MAARFQEEILFGLKIVIGGYENVLTIGLSHRR